GVRRDDRKSGHGKRGKGCVVTERSAGRVTRYNSEMIGGSRGQAVDVNTDRPGRVSGLSLGSGCESVARGCSILKMKSSAQPIWVERPFKCSGKTRDERCRISCDDRRTWRRSWCWGRTHHYYRACLVPWVKMPTANVPKRTLAVERVSESRSLVTKSRI